MAADEWKIDEVLMTTDQSWPGTKITKPTPDERAVRALNLLFGRSDHSPWAIKVLANEIKEAEDTARFEHRLPGNGGIAPSLWAVPSCPVVGCQQVGSHSHNETVITRAPTTGGKP